MKYLLLLLCLSLSVACDDSLPMKSEVEDLRILAISATPPQLNIDKISDWDIPHATFEALVVHPDKKPVNYTWQFCPAESSKGCRDFESLLPSWDDSFAELGFFCELVLADSDAPAAPEAVTEERWNKLLLDMQTLYNTKQSGVIDAIVSDPATVRYPIPPFEVTLLEDLGLFHCLANIIGTPAGWWPSAILTVSDDEKSILGQKRVTLTISDLGSPTKSGFFTGALGAPVCTEELTTDCIPYNNIGTEQNTLNTNPQFEVIQKSADDLASSPFCDLTGSVITNDCELPLPLAVQLEEPFRINPIMTANSQERYQVIETNLDEQKLIISDRNEELSISWFATEGTIQDELTWPKFTKSLDTVWTPPTKMPAKNDGLVWIWMVARDQRGGTAWFELPLTLN